MGFSIFGRGKQSSRAVEEEHDDVLPVREATPKPSGEKRSGEPVDRTVRTAIFTFLGILAFGTPLFFTGLTVQGVIFDRYMFFLLFSLLAFVSWVVGGVYAGSLTLKRTPLDIPIFLFLGAYVISMIFSVDLWHSFVGAFSDPSRGFIVVMTGVLLYYVVVSTQSRQSLYRLTGLFTAGLSFFAVWSALAISGIFQGVSGAFSFLNVVPVSDFLSLNLLVSVTFPVVLASFLHTVSVHESSPKRTVKTVVWFAVIVAYLYLLAVLFLAPTLIALFVGLGIFISYLSGDIVRVSKKWLWLPIAIFFLVLPGFYFLGQNILAKDGIQLSQGVSQGVGLSWEVLKNTLSERFFSGTGPATYGYDFSHYFPESLNKTDAFASRLMYAPNYFFEIIATTGILGGLAFFGLLIFALSVAVYLLTQRREVNSPLSLGLWVGVLVLLIVGFFYGISGAVIFPGVLLAVLAMAVLLNESEARMQSITFSLRSAPQYALASTLLLLVACIGALALFATLGKSYTADIYAGHAFGVQGSDKKQAIGSIEKAIGLNAREGQYFIFRGRMYFAVANEELAKLKENPEEKDIQQIQLLVVESWRSIVRGRDLMPGSIFAQEALIQVLEALGKEDDVINAYRDAMKIEPKNPIYPTKIAEIRIVTASRSQDKKEEYFSEAEKLLESALALKQNYGEAWYQKALLWEGRKNLDRALEHAQKATSFSGDMRSYLLVARLYQLRNGDGDVEKSEDIYKKLLTVNNKEVYAQLGLAGLYEKTGRSDEAIASYTKVRDLLPDGAETARKQLNDIITALKDGTRQEQIRAQSQEQGIVVPAPEGQ